jgi:putative ABC transport system substrate-binding protein
MRQTAKPLGLQIEPFEAQKPDQLKRAISAAVAKGAEAVDVIDDPIWFENARSIAELVNAQRLPSIGFLELAEAGALMAYGADQFVMWARSAVFVDKVLKGVKPAELPIEQASRFKFVINLKTATALGLTIPYMLSGLADEVIE